MRISLAVLASSILLAACDSKRPMPELVQAIVAADHADRQRLAVEIRAHGEAATAAWIQLLEHANKDYNLYVIAAGELGALGNAGAAGVPALARFLRDGFPGMQDGDLSVEQRVKTPDAARTPARTALAKIGTAALPAVRELLTHEKGRVREQAAFTVGQIGPGAAAAAPNMIRLLGDADRAVAIAAAWSLGEIQTASAEVKKALVDAFRNEEPLVRFEAIRALGKFGKAAADVRERIRSMAGDPDGGVRRMALETLQQLEDSPAGGAPDRK